MPWHVRLHVRGNMDDPCERDWRVYAVFETMWTAFTRRLRWTLPQVPCRFGGRPNKQGHACFTTMRRQAGQLVIVFQKCSTYLHDSSIGGKLPSYTIWSCICIDTHNVQGVGFWFIERAWTGILYRMYLLRNSERRPSGTRLSLIEHGEGVPRFFVLAVEAQEANFFFSLFLFLHLFSGYVYSRLFL